MIIMVYNIPATRYSHCIPGSAPGSLDPVPQMIVSELFIKDVGKSPSLFGIGTKVIEEFQSSPNMTGLFVSTADTKKAVPLV